MITAYNACERAPEVEMEFRYDRCEWHSGDSSGGTFGPTSALVGVDAGNLRRYVVLPMSRTPAITDVWRTTNVPGGPAGLWRFQARDGTLVGVCAGAGAPCEVRSLLRACGRGVGACDGTSVRCAQRRAPRDERCNGVDDDCDCLVDEGGDLYTRGLTCDRGACATRCGTDADCAAGQACDASRACVGRACLDRICPVGTRCVAGACVDACAGVVCSGDDVCHEGRCVARCAGVTCPPTWVCEFASGGCVPRCECVRCAEGRRCGTDGRCVASDCADSARRDLCDAPAGVSLCPRGEVCRAGRASATSSRRATREPSTCLRLATRRPSRR